MTQNQKAVMDLSNRERVVLALCSRARPNIVEACLLSLISQHSTDKYTLEILIVENDLKENLRVLVEAMQRRTEYKIYYFLEDQIGIPHARNRAVNEALNLKGDYLVFIDDDEIANPDWILELVNTVKRYTADIVHGQVIYEYPGEDKWAYLKNNTVSDSRKDGKILHSAATNNVLISKGVIAANPDGLNLRFDTKMQFTGGSDTDFFNRAKLANKKIVYSHKAIVRETVPIERCSLKWLFMREARIKAAAVYIDSKNFGRNSAVKKHLKRALQDFVHGLGYLIRCLPCFIISHERGRQLFLFAYLKLADIYGRVSGIRGKLFQPYRVIEGC